MRVLAFDLGATFGWALGERNLRATVVAEGHSEIAAGTILVPAIAKPYTFGEEFCRGDRPERLAGFYSRSYALIERKQPGLVVYECPFTRGDAATRSLKGMAGVLEAAANQNRVAVTDAGAVVTFKKHWTGKHNASKEEMIAEAARRGYVCGEHAADALAVLDYTLTHLETD